MTGLDRLKPIHCDGSPLPGKVGTGSGDGVVLQYRYSESPYRDDRMVPTGMDTRASRRGENERILAMAACGMVNRSGPAIYFDYDGYLGEVKHFGDAIPASTREFRRYYEETRSLAFIEAGGLRELLADHADGFRGIFLYPDLDVQSLVLAVNLANLNYALPVARSLYEDYRAEFGDLPVLEDLDVSDVDPESLYGWMVDELVPLCNREMAYSMGYPYMRSDGVHHAFFHTMGMDYAFLRKCFFYFMSCNERNRGAYDFLILGGEKEDRIHRRILDSLIRPAAIMGWNETEWRHALTATRSGHFVYCTDWGTNLSFHAAMPPLQPPPYRMNPERPPVGRPMKKVYLSIVANEGDTPKMVSQLYNDGWLKPGRGRHPANWAINPTHCVHFPSLVEYYHRTKTPNDHFTMAPNGAGYDTVRENDHLEEFLAYTARMNTNLGLEETDLWYADRAHLEGYARLLPGLRGLSIEPHVAVPDGEMFQTGGLPVVRHVDRFYYWYGKGDLCRDCAIDREKTDRYLAELHEQGPLPKFVPIYGYESSLIDDAADYFATLDPERFELVDYRTFFELAAQVVQPLDRSLSEVEAKVLWADDSLRTADWRPVDGDAILEVTDRGLRVTVPAGQESASVVVRGVVLHDGVRELLVSAAAMSPGSDWMFWMFGDYDGFGLEDRWEPFWKPKWPGARSEEIPRRVARYAPRASDRLVLCVEGGPGHWVEFDRVEFIGLQSEEKEEKNP